MRTLSRRSDARATRPAAETIGGLAGRVHVQATVLAGLASLVWLIAGSRTPDLAAQSYRVGLFTREGFAIWDNNWYAGHHLPAYSLLFPPLGGLIGMRLVGVLAAVVAAFCFARLAELHFGSGARIGILWFALATVADLAIGRLTYALASAVGLAALYAASRRRTVLAGVLAAACGAAAPLAGLFVGMAAAGVLLAGWREPASRRTGLALGIPAVGAGLLLTLAFPEGGREPFGTWPMIISLGLTLGFLGLLPRGERVLRAGAWLYVVGTAASFVLVTPIGDNTTRVGADFAGPLLACALLGRGRSAAAGRPIARTMLRRWGRPSSLRAATGGLLVGLLAWQVFAPVREQAKGFGDPISRQSTYRGLLAYLGAHDTGPGRIEVTFTESHWEAAILAPLYPLARGWEKQLDTGDNPLFYRHPLSAATYHAWLEQVAVRYVVVANARLDPSSRPEAKLVLGGLPYLRAVWSDPHWRVFAVVDPAPLASPPASVTGLGHQSFVVDFTRPGTSLVRIRFSPYWRAQTGCVGRGPGGFTDVSSRRAGRVAVTIAFSVGRILDHGVRCA
ncbi:MAG TPA: hypothetical protein VG165_15865 [Solirubrobacteraceae bacterium]|nr:hypothetical protein [Solirubrobacteraceae bacterium]